MLFSIQESMSIPGTDKWKHWENVLLRYEFWDFPSGFWLRCRFHSNNFHCQTEKHTVRDPLPWKQNLKQEISSHIYSRTFKSKRQSNIVMVTLLVTGERLPGAEVLLTRVTLIRENILKVERLHVQPEISLPFHHFAADPAAEWAILCCQNILI